MHELDYKFLGDKGKGYRKAQKLVKFVFKFVKISRIGHKKKKWSFLMKPLDIRWKFAEPQNILAEPLGSEEPKLKNTAVSND